MERRYFDVKLLELTEGEAVYQYQGREMRRPVGLNRSVKEHGIEKIGELVVNDDSGEAGYFRPYVEQRLRRVIECDIEGGWAWTVIGDDTDPVFFVKAGIVPGIDGHVIYDETEAVTLQVPPEFIDLCGEFKLTPEAVLRGFIADACGLMNYVAKPREDGYSANGSDERRMADDYIERAWAPFRNM